MSDIETTRWRADRSRSEQPAPAPDPAVAAAKVEQRAALAVDRQNAMIEYEANRRALIENTERLKALRLARDAAAVLEAPKRDAKKPAAKAAKAPAKRAP